MREVKMKVLVACEFSGRVRDSFLELGHDAMSCDIIPSERDGPHYQGDVRHILHWGFDLLIAHPPCNYLSNAGSGWFNEDKYGVKAVERKLLRQEAYDFFMLLYNAPIPRICVENPQGYINSHFRKPDQIINPFNFGEPKRKRTCLWLKGLPPLVHTEEVEPEGPMYHSPTGHARHWVDGHPDTKDRQKNRSRTFWSIARAMASQWGSLNV